MKEEETNKNPREEINYFDNGYEFLSNMYPAKVVYQGLEFQTSEAAFQSGKFDNPEYKKMFTNLKPYKKKKYPWKNLARPAKKLGGANGQISKNDPDAFDEDAWKNGKSLQVMNEVVRAKFSSQNPDLVEKLLATGDAKLIEGTYWGDRFWGVDLKTRTLKGENHLGKILMDVRRELKESKQ